VSHQRKASRTSNHGKKASDAETAEAVSAGNFFELVRRGVMPPQSFRDKEVDAGVGVVWDDREVMSAAALPASRLQWTAVRGNDEAKTAERVTIVPATWLFKLG
jgi:hypothetical protein